MCELDTPTFLDNVASPPPPARRLPHHLRLKWLMCELDSSPCRTISHCHHRAQEDYPPLSKGSAVIDASLGHSPPGLQGPFDIHIRVLMVLVFPVRVVIVYTGFCIELAADHNFLHQGASTCVSVPEEINQRALFFCLLTI